MRAGFEKVHRGTLSLLREMLLTTGLGTRLAAPWVVFEALERFTGDTKKDSQWAGEAMATLTVRYTSSRNMAHFIPTRTGRDQ